MILLFFLLGHMLGSLTLNNLPLVTVGSNPTRDFRYLLKRKVSSASLQNVGCSIFRDIQGFPPSMQDGKVTIWILQCPKKTPLSLLFLIDHDIIILNVRAVVLCCLNVLDKRTNKKYSIFLSLNRIHKDFKNTITLDHWFCRNHLYGKLSLPKNQTFRF